jgi:hypothetical protein
MLTNSVLIHNTTSQNYCLVEARLGEAGIGIENGADVLIGIVMA